MRSFRQTKDLRPVRPKQASRRNAVAIRFLTAVTLVACSSIAAFPVQEIKVATLAPEGSPWVDALRAIDADLREATASTLGLRIYPGGVQGEEEVIIRKMRVGQLHAAGFGGTGVSKLFPDVLALETPFLFSNYDEIDYVLEQMRDYYTAGYADNGYVLLGWVDVGFIHLLSKGPIAGIDDLKELKVWRLQDEPITGVLFKKAGVTSVPLSIPDVLLGLQTNLVEVVYASPAAAIILQWFTKVTHFTDLPINYALGAFLMDKRVFDQLPPEQAELLRSISWKHMRQEVAHNREQNAEALEILELQGLTRVVPPEAEIRRFRALVDESMLELTGNAFSRESADLVQKHLHALRHPGEKP
jgi:TRAP-type C4-dicarboxylate transport system substrate-binding protein